MNRFTKLTVGAGAAALAAITAASPAQAQYYPYPQNGGVDVGQIVRGVAVAGAVSAAVGAITNAVRGGAYGNVGNRNGGYGYPTTTYPNTSYPNSSYPSGGYSYPGTTYPSTNYPTGGNAYPGGYGVQANGYASFESAAVNACGAQAQRYGRASVDNVERRSNSSVRVRGMIEASANVYGGGIERRTFDCSFRNDGRVTQFETNKVRY